MSDKVLFIKDKNEVIIQGVSFECPNNWIMCPMSEADLEFANGNYAEKYPKKEEILSAGVPFFRANNIKDGYIIAEDMVYISKEKHKELQRGHLKTGDVIIAIRGNIGKSGMITEVFEGANLNAQLSVIRSKDKEKIIPAYINYMCLSPMLQMQFGVYTTGTALKQLSEKNLHSCIIAIPPIAEQQRIVEQIESLFAKLDEAKEKIQITIENIEKNRAAVLQEAFNGNLTKLWREENSHIDNEWKSVALGDVLTPVKDKYDPTSNTGLDIPYIGLEHIEKGRGICSNGSSKEVKSLKTLFKKGDVLYGKLRPYLNKHDVAEFDGMCSTDILVYRANNLITSKYINYMFNTINFMEYAMENSSGINLPRTSEKAVSAYKIKISSIAEQTEIVRILDTIFEKQENVISFCKGVLEQIDSIKKSILAKAFRGKLGTNNPNEENAVELLKSILVEE